MRIRQVPRFQFYKYKFNKKIKINCLNHTNNSLQKNGVYLIKFKENCQLQFFQLKGLYFSLLPFLKKYKIKLWLFANFQRPLTAKPALRMGTGKGKLKYFISHYKKGEIFLEFEDIINLVWKKKFFKALRSKLPVHTIIKKNYH